MIALPGAATVTRRRYPAQTRDSGGYPVAGTPTDTSLANVSWQPPTWTQVQQLSEGDRTRQPRLYIAFSDLRAADPRTQLPADEIVDGALVYKVVQVEDVPAVGPLARHWEAVCLLRQELGPIGGGL